jgi:hypothetical protein
VLGRFCVFLPRFFASRKEQPLAIPVAVLDEIVPLDEVVDDEEVTEDNSDNVYRQLEQSGDDLEPRGARDIDQEDEEEDGMEDARQSSDTEDEFLQSSSNETSSDDAESSNGELSDGNSTSSSSDDNESGVEKIDAAACVQKTILVPLGPDEQAVPVELDSDFFLVALTQRCCANASVERMAFFAVKLWAQTLASCFITVSIIIAVRATITRIVLLPVNFLLQLCIEYAPIPDFGLFWCNRTLLCTFLAACGATLEPQGIDGPSMGRALMRHWLQFLCAAVVLEPLANRFLGTDTWRIVDVVHLCLVVRGYLLLLKHWFSQSENKNARSPM